MTGVAVGLFLLGFVASWVAGRHIGQGAALIQGGAVGICGVAALFIGMAEVVNASLVWGLLALALYGLVAALIFKSAKGVRERAE